MSAPTGEPTGKRRLGGRWLALALVVVMAAVAACQVLTGAAGPVARAAADLSSWRGVAYRGTVVDPHGTATGVEIAVAADGTAHGTVTRATGARAEIAADRSGTMLRGDRGWWLTGRPVDADALADRWVADPPDGTTGLPPLTMLTPSGLADLLRAGPSVPWAELGAASDHHDGSWSDGRRTVSLSATDPVRPTAVTLPLPVPRPPALRVFTSAPAAASTTAAPEVEGPKEQEDPDDLNDLEGQKEQESSDDWRASFEDLTPLSGAGEQELGSTVGHLRYEVGPLSLPVLAVGNEDWETVRWLADHGVDGTALAASGLHGPALLRLVRTFAQGAGRPNSRMNSSQASVQLLREAVHARAVGVLDVIAGSSGFRVRLRV